MNPQNNPTARQKAKNEMRRYFGTAISWDGLDAIVDSLIQAAVDQVNEERLQELGEIVRLPKDDHAIDSSYWNRHPVDDHTSGDAYHVECEAGYHADSDMAEEHNPDPLWDAEWYAEQCAAQAASDNDIRIKDDEAEATK